MARESRPNARRRSIPPGRGRWAEWARALSERHGRVAARRELPDLILVRRPRPLRLLRQHWLTVSRWFRPQLNLTIQTLLRREGSREQSRVLPFVAREDSQAAPPPGAYSPAPGVALGPPVFLRLRSALERLSRERAPEGRASAVFERGGVPAPTPLQMVFRRAADPPARGPATALADGTHALLQRIVEQSRRIEERAPAGLVLRRQEATAPQSFAGTVAEHTPPPPQHAGQWAASPAPPQGVADMEQITEQVMRQLDRRVVAARERMGRV